MVSLQDSLGSVAMMTEIREVDTVTMAKEEADPDTRSIVGINGRCMETHHSYSFPPDIIILVLTNYLMISGSLQLFNILAD